LVENEKHFKPLDNAWITNFEKTDKLYQDYYKEDNHYTNIHYIYVNKNNEIEKIKQDFVYMLKPNYIFRDELIGILKRNAIEDNIRYSLLSILKINVTIGPDDIKGFLTSDNLDDYTDRFFSLNKNIDTIVFEKTINMFQDLNDILIIFYEENKNDIKSKPKNFTKKIFLHSNLISNHKKTIKKLYKE
jgi:hypothetical protein